MEDDKLLEEVKERSGNLQRALSPIIDQWVLLKIREQETPPPLRVLEPRFEEYFKLQEFLIGLVHQILGYNPPKN